MPKITPPYRKILVFLVHIFLIVLAYALSYATRYEFSLHKLQTSKELFVATIIPLLTIRILTYWYLGLFRGLWRYVSVKDLENIIKAAVFGTLLFTLFTLGMDLVPPRSVLILDLTYNILFVSTVRIAVRIYREATANVSFKKPANCKNILIVGAGSAGEMVLREMLKNPRLGYNPIGFIDDDRGKLKRSIHGVSVLGNTKDISKIVSENGIEEIIVAIPSATSESIRKIVGICRQTNVKFKTLPYISDLMDDKVILSQIRDVSIEDLLGRDPVNLDMSLIGREIQGRTVLVTGAAGSIGSELVRQLARFSPRKIVMFERNENDLFKFELDIRKEGWESIPVSFVGDIRDKDRIRDCMELHRPSYIFHAAAYKHVPAMELNPTEAIKNNVFGTKNLVDLAIEYNVEKFVLISTDKAVRPTNVMGATKRVAELILQAKSLEKCLTQFVAVRFGNVLGSNGSVIPIFKKQIAEGGPVTVTHPEVTRYFMTIPEAVQLVIQASAMGNGGEIFVLKMGEPVKIVNLAKNLIRLSGLIPGKDIEIAYTGLRPGEKLYEELLTEGEDVKRTCHDKIWVLGEKMIFEHMNHALKKLNDACNTGRSTEIKVVLREIVPEYHYTGLVEPVPIRTRASEAAVSNLSSLNPSAMPKQA